ncbi:C40 family peptidase [Sphingosinicella soli]|uniref:Cell wall-associated NlpC family hydrolase n=1 Tax=Sphingosinicella soli TaxID=333708 RepID=A0A7W7F518_9SPHN|nr:C40 family peptidase [Sphingosinicella soli]MBB4630935.1 cell wall-associated NlpC family hydrolase [Sphingosinicella soli]
MPTATPNAKTAPTSSARRPDPRTHAWRDDLADAALEGVVDAPRFAVPVRHRLTAPQAPIRKAPDADAVAVSELLSGEAFDVLDVSGGVAWGYSVHDHYVGYVDAALLADAGETPTHRIAAPTALIFARPDIKSTVLGALPMGALIGAAEHDEKFAAAAGGYVHRRHIAAIDDHAADPAAVAELFLGTPYKWGGRTRGGIDCSGLVQIALGACGIDCPRDSDMQAALGREVEDRRYRRGDLVFFPGHVGFMHDETRLLHANAFFMSTVIEPLDDVVGRLLPQYDEPVTAVRRL